MHLLNQSGPESEHNETLEHLKTLTSESKLLVMKDPFKDVNRRGHSDTHDTQNKQTLCQDESQSGMGLVLLV